MIIIEITTQKQLDALDLDFKGRINITGSIDKIDKYYPNAEIYVYGSAQITYVSDSAQIRNVSDSAQIRNVYGSAQIRNVYGSAQIRNVYGSAQITYVYGSAQITDVSGSAQITDVYGSANVLFIDEQAGVSTNGNNIVSYWKDKSVILNTSKQTTIVVLDRDNSTWDSYVNMYPVKIKGKKAIMYKAVRKENDKYFSNHDKNFEYKIGKKAEAKCDSSREIECSYGIHISHKMWAINFSRGWDNVALLEVEVEVSTIVVPEKCDGKVRTHEVKVIREIPKEEWYA